MPDIILGEERGALSLSDRGQNDHVQIAQSQFTQGAQPSDQAGQVQLAQGAASIGTVTNLTGQATIIRASGETVQAALGTPVFQDDTFETAAGSGVGLQFEDGSSFSLGADARLTIDSFVYDAGGADSNMVMNLAQGAFSFVSGQVAKSGENNMSIVTPTATIGIRGTAGAGDDDEVVLLQEPGQQVGELTVTTPGGTVSLTTPNAYTNTSDPFAPPTPPTTQSLGDIQSRFGAALRDLPVQLPANQNLPGSGNNGGGQGQVGPDSGQPEAGPEDETGEDDQSDGQDGGEEGDVEDTEAEEIAPEGELGDEEVDEGDEGDEGGEGEEGALGDGPDDGGDLAGGDALGDGPGDDFADGGDDDVDTADAGDTGDGDADGAEGDAGDEGGDEGGEGPDGGPEGDGGAAEGGGDTAGAGTFAGGTGTGSLAGGSGTDKVTKKAPLTTNQDSVLKKTGLDNPDQKKFVETVGDDVVESQQQAAASGEAAGEGEEGAEETGLGEPPPPPPAPPPETGDDEPPPPVVDEPPPEESGPTVPTFALTAGADTVTFAEANEVIRITGVTQAGDNFIDAGPASPQFAVLDTAGPHTFTTNGIETIFFNFTLNSGDTHNITIAGTTAANFDAAGGSFDGNVLGDAANNTLTILDDSGIEAVFQPNFANTSGDTFTGSIDLLGGADIVDFSGAGSDLDFQIDVSNVESYFGSLGNDDITLLTLLAAGDIFDGGGPADVDILNLLTGTNIGSVLNFETVNGTAGADALTLENTQLLSFNTLVDLGSGSDTLNLADGTNTLGIANTEFVFAGAAADTLSVTNNLLAGFGTTIDLGAGVDNLVLADGGNDISVENIETIGGGVGADIITLLDALVNGDVYDGGGSMDGDVLNLPSGVNIGSIINFETVNGVNGIADDLTLQSVITDDALFDLGNFGDGDILRLADGATNLLLVQDLDTLFGGTADDDIGVLSQSAGLFDLGSGFDTLDATGAGNFTISQAVSIEQYDGSTGVDNVTLGSDLFAGSVYDGGAGADVLTLFGGSNNVAAIFNFEQIFGSGGNDNLTFEAPVGGSPVEVDLGAGSDILNLADGGNILTITNVEFTDGGFGDDVITVNNAGAGVTITDISTGDFDQVINGDGGSGIFTLDSIEQFTGGVSFDDVTLQSDLTVGSVYDGGSGGGQLTLALGSLNSGLIVNFDQIVGGAGNESLVFEAPVGGTPVLIDMLTGVDDVTLADGGNVASFLDTEFIFGGTGGDQIFLDDTFTTDIDLGAGADEVVLNQNGGTYNFSVFAGVELLTGVDGGPFEIVNFFDAQVGLEIDLGLFGDGDQVNLADGVANSVKIFDLNNIFGGTGDDTVILGTSNAGQIALGGGNDLVDASLVAGSNINTLTDVENFIGSAGADIIGLGSVLLSGSAYSGGADGDGDILQLFDGVNAADIAHFETILGGAAADTLTLEGALDTAFQTVVDLGAGFDDLFLANSTNDVKVLNIETVNGGTGNDTVELLNDMLSGDTFNGQGGFDTLKLLSGSTNTGTILDFEQVFGVDGTTETITLETNIATDTLFDLGLQSDLDSLTLLGGGNIITIQDLNQLNGGTGNDIVTVLGDVFSGAVYNGGGAGGDLDELILQDGATIQASISDFEQISGNTSTGINLSLENGFNGNIVFSGSGIDTVTMLSSTNTAGISGVENFTGGPGGGDSVQLLSGGDTVNIAEVDIINGSAGNDTINIIDTTSADINLGLGDDTLTGATGVTDFIAFTAFADAVADGVGNGAETITNFEVGIDQIEITAFGVGNFFYNGAGAFTGGGTASSRFVNGTESLEIDIDGDSNADLEIVMNGIVDTDLSVGDFAF